MPENTSQRPPEAHLLGILADGQSSYITGMEADGQRQLVASEVLPTELIGDDHSDFEALGFTFGEPDPNDPLFMPATLPEGWRREGSGHDMWSYIVDERGVRRVAIFYKAAFYDRSAHMHIERPGRSAASEFIYSDTEPPWDVLTDAERADFVDRLKAYLEDAERHPDIYGHRAPKVRARLDALTESPR